MRLLTIALAQTRQTADFDANAATILRTLERAGAAGVQILCFPEAQTAGYRVDITPAAAPVPVAQLTALHAQVAQRCGELGMACVLGTETPLATDPAHGKPYNSALVVAEDGQILGAHHKTKLTPLDAVAYTPGSDVETFVLHGVTVGVVICFEGLRFPETTRACVRQGAQVVFHPQNNTTRPNAWKLPIHHALITTRAAENTVWFASCNCCHTPHQNSRSLVIAPDGRVHAATALRREQLLITDIDIDRATQAMVAGDPDGCAAVLFAETVARDEYAAVASPWDPSGTGRGPLTKRTKSYAKPPSRSVTVRLGPRPSGECVRKLENRS
jgi:predicted amidohydrolase